MNPVPCESPPPTLLDLLRSTLSLFEYYDGLEVPHQPVMDELMACMRRAIAEMSAVAEANETAARRPVMSEVPRKVREQNQPLEQEMG